MRKNQASVSQDLTAAFTAFPCFNHRFEFGIRSKKCPAGILAKPVSTLRASKKFAVSFVNTSDGKVWQENKVGRRADESQQQEPPFSINAMVDKSVKCQASQIDNVRKEITPQEGVIASPIMGELFTRRLLWLGCLQG
jgi:hypothetical protein